jgi:CheY-like chemotaxis protein
LLVVDDDPIMRQLETHILRHHGYQVLQADTAVEALRLAADTAPIHLLITDYLMPEVDGFQLTRRLRGASKDPRADGFGLIAADSAQSRRSGPLRDPGKAIPVQ